MYIDSAFRKINEITKSRNIDVLIVYLATDPTRNPEKIIWKEASEKFGWAFLDTSQAFEERDWRRYCIYRRDCHPNNEANRLFANEIYPAIKNIISKKHAG